MTASRLNTRDTARQIGIHRRTLERWRKLGHGPAFLEIGRSIRYEQVAIDEFLDRCRNPKKETAGGTAGDVSAVHGA